MGDCPSCGGETSNKPGKIANEHGLKPKEVKDKIHELKGDTKLPNNPDVEVCNDCGEVFHQTEEGAWLIVLAILMRTIRDVRN